MKKGDFYVVIGLLLIVILSGVGVVYAKYESRKIFRAIEKNRIEQNAVEAEWGRLQLELGTRTNYSRIEDIAINKLKLYVPKAENIIVIDFK